MNLVAASAVEWLSAWQNFYVIVGSAGGALIGLQFVVIVLIASIRSRADGETINAFGTPTVVHFGGAILVAAVMCAPWPSPLGAAAALAACGVGGLGYSAVVFLRARRQTGYRPVLEDWVWYVIVPSGVYAALAVAAILVARSPQVGLFLTGGAALGLLFVGIHNAWDTVTHLVIAGPEGEAPKPK